MHSYYVQEIFYTQAFVAPTEDKTSNIAGSDGE